MGTAKSGVGIASMGALKPDLIMKSIIPVVMADILGIYGLIVAVILVQTINSNDYTFFNGYKHLAFGLSSLAAGIVGNAGVMRTPSSPSDLESFYPYLR